MKSIAERITGFSPQELFELECPRPKSIEDMWFPDGVNVRNVRFASGMLLFNDDLDRMRRSIKTAKIFKEPTRLRLKKLFSSFKKSWLS